MFRYVIQLKGILIDIDSFPDDLGVWDNICAQYRVCFMTESDQKAIEIRNRYGDECVYQANGRVFWPNEETHRSVLNRIGLLTTEVAYVSADISFIINAQVFLSGTILIYPEQLTYEEISRGPDAIYDSIKSLEYGLHTSEIGFYGEVSLNPLIHIKKGFILSTLLPVQNEKILLFILGRYFGYSHYMNQLHPYSSGIYLNKQQGKKYYGVFNEEFGRLFSGAVKIIKQYFKVDCVCNVPTRPGKDNRFSGIVKRVAEENQIEDISSYFYCLKNYDTQKTLSEAARKNNIQGVFSFNGDLTGKVVALVDDVITTGATVKECSYILKKHNAAGVIVVVLGVNQLGGSYWWQQEPSVKCPNCGRRMYLMVNSHTRSFFYSCQCGKTLDYKVAYEKLAFEVNNEFTNR